MSFLADDCRASSGTNSMTSPCGFLQRALIEGEVRLHGFEMGRELSQLLFADPARHDFVDLDDILRDFAQDRLGLRGEMQAMNAPVARIAAPLDEAPRLQPVDQPPDRDRLDFNER